MTKVEQIKAIVKHLKYIERITSIKDLSRQLDMNYATVNQAVNGNEKYLTDNFLVFRIGSVYSDVFNLDWLRTGTGEMLKTPSSEGAKFTQTGKINVAADGNGNIQMPAVSISEEELNPIIQERDRLRIENDSLKRENIWLRSLVEKYMSSK